MKRVLIIEDDQDIAELERDYLEANGFTATLCGNGLEGEKLALAEPVDIIVLDIMLPGEDGFQVCRNIRQHKNIPILLVSARQEDIDKIRGLGLGLTIILSNLLVLMNSWLASKRICPGMNSSRPKKRPRKSCALVT